MTRNKEGVKKVKNTVVCFLTDSKTEWILLTMNLLI